MATRSAAATGRLAVFTAAFVMTGGAFLAAPAAANASAPPLSIGIRCDGYTQETAAAAGYTTFVDVSFTNGTSGKDWIVGTGGSNDVLSGGAGDDIICSGGGADFLYGQSGNDQLFLGDPKTRQGQSAGPGATAEGDSGDDVIQGGPGPDTIYGDSPASGRGAPADGNDTLFGGDGVDKLYGDGGNDALTGGRSASSSASGDIGDGGDGDDTCVGIATPTSC